MSVKRKQAWDNYKQKVSNKRAGKGEKRAGPSIPDGGITVQRLSADVEGKCQKYSRIGPLTLVPLDKEPTLANIKSACKTHFSTSLDCDVLAGERGPSYTDTSQIKNWKVLHVRFIEPLIPTDSSRSFIHPPPDSSSSFIHPSGHKSEPTQESPRKDDSKHVRDFKSAHIPKSVSVSQMLKIGKVINPDADVVKLRVEEFSIAEKMYWLDPVEVTMSVQREPFAEGAFHRAYKAKVLSGLPKGDYVVKKYKPEEVEGISSLFGSIEEHTRKSVQLNALARNFAESMAQEAPTTEFGSTFHYNKVYFSCMSGEYVTIEKFIEGTFIKWINNTGDVCVEKKDTTEVSLKAEAFVHYTYIKSKKQLMVTDIQGIGYTLCDPEIATVQQCDPDDQSIYFCTGNLSNQAIDPFFEKHECNMYCRLLELPEIQKVC